MKNIDFKDLEVWKKSKKLAIRIYLITDKGKFLKDWSLKDQIRRAIISVSSNIAEGYNRNNIKEFKHFLKFSKGSCAEVMSQFEIAKELGYIDNENYEQILDELTHLINMLGKLIKVIS